MERLEQRTDEELIAAVNGGDAGAFEALYFRYKEWVAGLAWRLTGDPDIASDVLQETFIYFLKKFPGFRLTANLKTFLYPAVRNLSIQARRKGVRYQSTEQEKEFLERVPAASPPAGVTDAVALVLQQLPEEQRDVLLLRFVDGLSLQEIGQAMEIPLGTVKSRLHHGLQTLRSDPRTRELFTE